MILPFYDCVSSKNTSAKILKFDEKIQSYLNTNYTCVIFCRVGLKSAAVKRFAVYDKWNVNFVQIRHEENIKLVTKKLEDLDYEVKAFANNKGPLSFNNVLAVSRQVRKFQI